MCSTPSKLLLSFGRLMIINPPSKKEPSRFCWHYTSTALTLMTVPKYVYNLVNVHLRFLDEIVVFLCKYTTDGRNDRCRLNFRPEGLTAAFRKFPRTLEIWVFRLPTLTSHLSYPSNSPQWFCCTKNGYPGHEARKGFTKGKSIRFHQFLKHKELCGQEEWLSSKAGEWA